jgi:hypothetical protein
LTHRPSHQSGKGQSRILYPAAASFKETSDKLLLGATGFAE